MRSKLWQSACRNWRSQQLSGGSRRGSEGTAFPTYGEAEVLEALEEIQYLIDAEELLTTDQYHDYVVDFKRKTVVKALCSILPMTAILPVSTVLRKRASTTAAGPS